jgi:hypothetical protein
MALSQYVAINFLTKFDKKGLDRATKELKGFDKVVATGAFRLKSFAKAGAIAAAAGMAIFAKNSIQAALAQEKLDKQLQLTLKSIGKENLLPDLKIFINDLQRATNVTEDRLVPALRQLVAQTGDLDSAQLLLSKALDISAGTGSDLDSVLNAINKAAIGNYAAIGKLGVGFTAAEAKAMGFVELIQRLDKYAGAAEAQTETFEGQLKSFKISAGEATETLGNGFLIASSYIVAGTDNLKSFGLVLESVAGGLGDVLIGFGKTVSEKGFLAALNTTFEDLGKEGFKVRQKQYLAAKGYLGLSQQTIDALELQAKYGKKALTTDQQLAKIQADILARQKAVTKEKQLQELLDDKKRKLTAMFDLEQINLQAALTRKLSAEDQTRVMILQKLADGTAAAVNEALRYADVLKVIEDGQITTGEVEMLAKKWGITTTEVLIYLRTLFASNDELRKMLALLDEVNKKKKIEESKPTTPIGLTREYQLEQFATNTDPRVQLAVLSGQAPSAFGQEVVDRLRQQGATPAMAAMSGRYSAQAIAYYQGLLDIPRMAEGGIVNSPTLAMIGEAGTEAVIPLDKMGGFGTTVNVNVAGSVISEGQLQTVIQNALYNLNRSGSVTQLSNLGR